MFRFDYSREFLLWALTPPGFKSVWHAGVRVDTSGKMVAFISAIPATLRIHKTAQELVEINFLCVHKRLRSKRLAPVLIKEITRRVHCEGLFQACYTAGVKIPTPIAESRYYHRNLNPKKLASIQFAHKPSKLTMNEWIKRYRLDKNTSTPGLRKMELKDAQAVHTLLSAHQERFEVTPLFTVEEVEHWLVPRDNVINSFVVENTTTHDITDFISFYSLPSTIVNNREYSILSAAYSYYNVATSVPLEDLMRDALILANNLDYDVFNALDLMENDSFLTPLKFGRGDGLLRYYLYNFGCPLMNPSRLGLVLL
jgi:glycylpeptide N-tetradecanoyltransferase